MLTIILKELYIHSKIYLNYYLNNNQIHLINNKAFFIDTLKQLHLRGENIHCIRIPYAKYINKL